MKSTQIRIHCKGHLLAMKEYLQMRKGMVRGYFMALEQRTKLTSHMTRPALEET